MMIRPTTLGVLVFALPLLLLPGNAGGTEGQPVVGHDGASDLVSAQSREGASALPCDIPMRWRVTRVDRDFGLTLEEAADAVRAAAAIWESAVGRPLFIEDADDGFPIRFVYDERQARSLERGRAEDVLARASSELEAERDRLAEKARGHDEEVASHERRARDLQRRTAAYNETVRDWNRQGGAPEDVAAELAAKGRVLEEERRDLDARARALTEQGRALTEAEHALDVRIDEHVRRADELDRSFPREAVESGVYREAVLRQGDRITSVRREIRIYQFETQGELRVLAAHELGHALGLGHRDAPTSVMSEEHVGGSDSQVLPSDVARLLALCGEVVLGG